MNKSKVLCLYLKPEMQYLLCPLYEESTKAWLKNKKYVDYSRSHDSRMFVRMSVPQYAPESESRQASRVFSSSKSDAER